MNLKIVRKRIDNDVINLKLTGEMNIYSAGKLKDFLIKELKSCSGIVMDLTEVDEADTSGFQLILFIKREAEMLGKSFRVTEMSSRLKSIFTLYNEII